MLSKSPCGILLKLIYILEERERKPVDGKNLIEIIDAIQEKYPSILIYSTHKSLEGANEVVSFDYWSDLSVLQNTGRINIRSESINITMLGSLSADTIQIPGEIRTAFEEFISKEVKCVE